MNHLRDYQSEVIDKVRAAVSRGVRRILLVAPTGAGKTVIGSEVIRSAVAHESTVLFLAHRRELIQQCHDKLWRFANIDAGIIMAGVEPRPYEPVQIASIQSLWARAHRSNKIEKPPADVILVDEAHRALSRTYERILASYPNSIVIGLTATPCRGDGRGLGNFFEALVECPQVPDLIQLGHLVPTVVYAPSVPDLKGVKVRNGDYVEGQLSDRMNTDKLVGDVVEHWWRLASNRKTVVFASGVAHSIHLRDEFRRSGVMAEHVDGTTPLDERAAILRGLAEGNIDVVTNCMVLTEGWDCPVVSACVLARPTKQLGLYRQMVGRVLRPAPGKTDALVLDHSGATFVHGFAEDPVEWTLKVDKRATNPAHARRGDGDRPGLQTCPECSAVRAAGEPCPVCGWQPKRRGEAFDVEDGMLGRVRRDKTVADPLVDRERFHRQLQWIAEERNYKPGWVAHKFLEKFGAYPARRRQRSEEPTPEVRAWVRSRQIAYAKAQEKARDTGRAAL